MPGWGAAPASRFREAGGTCYAILMAPIACVQAKVAADNSGPEMRITGLVACLANRHAPTPYRVKWDGERFCGHCSRCGKSIWRFKRGLWRDAKRGEG